METTWLSFGRNLFVNQCDHFGKNLSKLRTLNTEKVQEDECEEISDENEANNSRTVLGPGLRADGKNTLEFKEEDRTLDINLSMINLPCKNAII